MQKDEEVLASLEASGAVVTKAEYDQAVEDWARNDEAGLAENQRLADELALALERIAKTRQALRLDEKWSVQHGALAVRSERDRAVAERDALRARLEATLRTSDYQIGDIVCWRGDRWFEGRIVGETAPEHKYLDSEVWDLEVTNPGTRYADFDMTGRPVHVSEDALVLVRRDEADPSPEASSEASPLIHLVTLSSDTGVMGEWKAFCHGCRETATGDMPRVAFWRDQHEADALVPTLVERVEWEQAVHGEHHSEKR